MKASRYVYGRHIRDYAADRAWCVAACHTAGDAALIAALLNAHAESNGGTRLPIAVVYGTTSTKFAPFHYDGGAF